MYHEMEDTLLRRQQRHLSATCRTSCLMESPVFYHTDHDSPDVVPEAGVEAVARAYAKIIDEVNKVERRDLQYGATTSTANGKQ